MSPECVSLHTHLLLHVDGPRTSHRVSLSTHGWLTQSVTKGYTAIERNLWWTFKDTHRTGHAQSGCDYHSGLLKHEDFNWWKWPHNLLRATTCNVFHINPTSCVQQSTLCRVLCAFVGCVLDHSLKEKEAEVQWVKGSQHQNAQKRYLDRSPERILRTHPPLAMCHSNVFS